MRGGFTITLTAWDELQGRLFLRALSAGSFSPNGERMWAGCRLLLTFLLAAVSEVVVTSVVPASLEATLAEQGYGGAKRLSFRSSRPWDGLSEIGWENALPLGKGAMSSLWLAMGWGRGLRDSQARGSGAGGDQWRASPGQWHRDPTGARISNLNSDTSFYLVFDFRLIKNL